MQKIILITCYFGKFPWYFSLFLKSCNYNPTVSFIIFSDCIIPNNLPNNIRIIPFTLKEFNLLATEKFGFEVNVKSAYKLCDFKPAYGIIFSEYIKTYSFWGITDIDIVFGRIREFMTNELLEQYDIVSVRNDYPTGSFMLFKNTKEINRLFMKSKDYKMVFTSDTHYCFDECNFKHNFLQEGGDIFDIDCEIESMHHVIKKEEEGNNLKAHFDFLVIEGLPGQLKWEKGFLSFKNEFEVLLHHLILYKGNRFTRKKKWKQVPDIFYIDKYMVRKNGLNTLYGFFGNFIYNKMYKYINKTVFEFDYFISQKLNSKVKKVEPNSYKLNDMHFMVSKNSKNNNQISYNGKSFFKVINSLFYRDSFFIQSGPFIRFQLKKKENQIVELRINGVVQIFKKDIA